MSETLPTQERHEAPKFDVTAERPRPQQENANAEREVKSTQIEQAQAALAAVEQSSSEQPAAPAAAANVQPTFIDKIAKKVRFDHSLKLVREQLKPGDKALSKLVHQPMVRAVSDASSKTVTRPSGLLGGGILAFVGSLAYLLVAKHMGLPYNYLLFLMFFVGGFALGLLVEMVVRGARHGRA